MKKIALTLGSLLLVSTAFANTVHYSGAASKKVESQDLRANPDFVATCPEQYLTYFDKSEGGPGAYSQCPDENISYIDKSEGGPGFYCAE